MLKKHNAGEDGAPLCVIPWMHRFTDEQGFHQLCCSAEGDGNILRNARGERLHISQQLTDEQVLNSASVALARY